MMTKMWTCANCGNQFTADVEWDVAADENSVQATPSPCPRCGGTDTAILAGSQQEPNQ